MTETRSFSWALARARDGSKITRRAWLDMDGVYLQVAKPTKERLIMVDEVTDAAEPFEPDEEDLFSDDWVVVD